MVKMDHQNGPQVEIAKMAYSAFKSAPFEMLNEPNMNNCTIFSTLQFFGWLPKKSSQNNAFLLCFFPNFIHLAHFGSHLAHFGSHLTHFDKIVAK